MLFKWFSRLLHTIVSLALLFIVCNLFAPLVEASLITTAFINEIHYDNSGTDENEFIEIAGISGLNLAGWSLHFYNGSNGNVYKNHTFDPWILADSDHGFGFASVYISGIQNGAPDGIVLADAEQNIIQFLSYEGSFTAISGIAAGRESVDIGVIEQSNTPSDYSLQLSGTGNQYQDFTWSSAQQNTFGQVNATQGFIPPDVTAITVAEPSSLLLFLLIFLSYSVRKVQLARAG